MLRDGTWRDVTYACNTESGCKQTKDTKGLTTCVYFWIINFFDTNLGILQGVTKLWRHVKFKLEVLLSSSSDKLYPLCPKQC